MRSAGAVTAMDTLNLHVNKMAGAHKERGLTVMTPTQCIWRSAAAALLGFSMLLWATPSHAQCYPLYTITTVTAPPVDLGGCYGGAGFLDMSAAHCPHNYGMFTDQITEFHSDIVVKAPLGAEVTQSIAGALNPTGEFGPHYDFWFNTPEHYGQYKWHDFNFKDADGESLGGWYGNVFAQSGWAARIILPAVTETYNDEHTDYLLQTCDITIPRSTKGAFPAGKWTLKHLQHDIVVTSTWEQMHADNRLTVKHLPINEGHQYRYRIAPHPFPEVGAWVDDTSVAEPKVIGDVDDGFGVDVEVLQGQDPADPIEDGYVFQNGYVFDYWRPSDSSLDHNPSHRWVTDLTWPPESDETEEVTAVWKHDVELGMHIVRVGPYREPQLDPVTHEPLLGTVTLTSKSVDNSPVTSGTDFKVRLTHGYEFELDAAPQEGYEFFACGYAERNLDTDDMFNAAFLPGFTLSGDVTWLTDKPIAANFAVPEPAPHDQYYSGGVITVFFVDKLLARRLREEKRAIAKALENCFDITSWLGDPVYPFSGEFCQDAEDLRVKGRGMDFVWSRKYSSRTGCDTAQGYRWDHNYNIYVELLGTAHILYHDGDGRIDVFAPSGTDNTWRAGGRADVLEYEEGEAPVLHMRNGTAQYFSAFPPTPEEPGGKITSIQDRNGNTITFSYDTAWRLLHVTDTLGRGYDVQHAGYPDRITGVCENYAGSSRCVTYQYDGDGNLVAVNGPGSGETTGYGYGSDGRHNLQTITDARGNAYLRNQYTCSDVEGDRVASQAWGCPDYSITFGYNFESLGKYGLSEHTAVTDRNGNVMDMSFGGSFLTQKSEVDATTQYSYNQIGMPTSIQYPNGNRTQYMYGTDPMNPIEVRRGSGTGSDDVVQEFTYLDGLAACACGTSIVKTHTDGRGKVTTNDYDEQGNLTATHLPGGGVEGYTYNAQGQVLTHTWPGGRTDSFEYTNGYMTGITQDAGGIGATISLERDARGNITQMVDASGNASSILYDDHDRVTRIDSPEVNGEHNFATVQYDENGNTTNVHFGNTGTEDYQEAAYEYEILNYRTETTLSGSSGGSLVTTYNYDGNRNVTSITPSEGGTPITFTYNARNLVTGVQRGSTVISYEYDANGNITAVNSGGGRHEYTYDGHDQLVTAHDPLGNLTALAYDANGNLTGVRREGQGGNLLAASYTYDDVDRLIAQAVGDATTTFEYSQASELTKATNPNGHSVSFGHDTMSRLTSVSNDVGDTASYTYDANGNVRTATQAGSGGTSYTTTLTYDALNRLAGVVDSASNQTSYGYDARSNVTSVTKANGKKSTFAYDGLNRLVQAIHDIDGLHVALGQTWDSQSRLASRTDGKGLTTQYGYDALDRLSQVTYANASVRSYSYDDFSNLTGITSPNGASASFTYDALRRMLSRTLTKGASSETAHFAYDGLSRLVSASVPGSQATREYDSLGNLTVEALNGEAVRATYDPAGNMLSQTYPHGRTL